MIFRRPAPAAPAEPGAVSVFKAFAAALAQHDWEGAAARVAEEIDVRWRECGRKQRFADRESYLVAWQERLRGSDNIDFHNIFGDAERVAVEFTRRRLNGLSRLHGTIICDVRDGVIVREFTHEVPD
jgi:hypothetical protein